MKVAILGGTGKFGRALAARLVEAGDEVVFGSRDEQRARAAADELGGRGARTIAAAGAGELIVFAVPAEFAVATARALRPVLQAPVLSVGAEVEFAAGTARPPMKQKSLAERISEAVSVPVAAGLHTIAAKRLAEGRPDEDAFVCGNDEEAKALALELARHVVAGRALDAGPLQAARALEAMTAVLLNLNRSHRTHTGVRVTGL